MKRSALSLIAVCLLTSVCLAQGDKQPKLFFRLQADLISDQKLAEAIKLMERAGKAGYTGIVILDNMLARKEQAEPKYQANLAKFRQACKDSKLQCWAALFPVGYANSLLSQDPNLAEAMPVRDVPFEVKKGQLVPVDDLKIQNGTFEDSKGDNAAGWEIDQPGRMMFVDRQETWNGKPSIRIEDIAKHEPARRARIKQPIKFTPGRNYHLSAMIKTEKFDGSDLRLSVLAPYATDKRTWLSQMMIYVKPTQDWTRMHMTFNTQDLTEGDLYVGSWAGKSGKMWIADVKIEPAGVVNMVRRDGAPFKATAADGKIILVEGKDIPHVKDPQLGVVNGKAGIFNIWHEPPVLKLPDGSSLKDGDKVLMSYYHTAMMCYGDQTVICMSEPKTYELLKWQVEQIHKNLKPDGYMMMHDEIRIHGWDESCAKRKLTCGQILADNMTKCAALIQKEDPGKPMVVWNDMFDPHHNAKEDGRRFVMCKGENSWHQSWLGLPKEVGLINWNAESEQSVKFFSRQGHFQFISSDNPKRLAELVGKYKELPGVDGAIYVTWSHDYTKLEAFAEALRSSWNAPATAPAAGLLKRD